MHIYVQSIGVFVFKGPAKKVVVAKLILKSFTMLETPGPFTRVIIQICTESYIFERDGYRRKIELNDFQGHAVASH